jgi:hypothetical protein
MGVSQNLTVTQKSRDFAGNFSKVGIKWISTQSGSSWNGYNRTAYYYVSVNGGAEKKYSVKYTLPQNTTNTILDITIVVPHRADGTASVKVRTWMDTDISLGVIQKSQTVTLLSIPRATTPTFSSTSAEIGSNVTINLKRAADSFTHTLTYSFGKSSGTIGTGIGTSVIWSIPSNLAAQIPNAVSGTCVITCKTYNGSTLIGTKTANLTLKIPSSVVPVINSVSIIEGTEQLKNHFTVFVQNNSTLAVSVNAVGAAGSNITKVETKIQDVIYSGTSFVSALITASGDVTVNTTVTDSRGRTATVTNTVAVAEYEFPTIYSMSAWRIDTSGNKSEDGERVSVRIHYFTSNIDNQNGEHENPRTYKLQYRRSDEAEFTTFESGEASLIHSQSHAYKSAPVISSDYSYVIRLAVADFFKTTVCDIEVPTAFTLMDFNSSGKGVAFGKVSEKDGMEVNMNTDFLKEVNVYSDSNNGNYINFRKKNGTLTAKVNSSENGGGLNIIIYSSDGTAKELTVSEDGGITLPIEETALAAETDITVNRSTVSRQGNVVLFYAHVTASNAIGLGNSKHIGTVPEGYRPNLSVATIGIQGNTGVCSAWVQNTGDVWIRPHSAASANTTFEFMLVYNRTATWGIQQEVIDDD